MRALNSKGRGLLAVQWEGWQLLFSYAFLLGLQHFAGFLRCQIIEDTSVLVFLFEISFKAGNHPLQ